MKLFQMAMKNGSIGGASHFQNIFILILEKLEESKYRAQIFRCIKIFNAEKHYLVANVI